jgi:hypothetical protein
VYGGVDFSDMISSILCLSQGDSNVQSCDPISGVSCSPNINTSNAASDPGSVSSSPSESAKRREKKQKKAAAKQENYELAALAAAAQRARGTRGKRGGRR